MKKKYSKSTINKVEINPEEAVLAGCKQKRDAPKNRRKQALNL